MSGRLDWEKAHRNEIVRLRGGDPVEKQPSGQPTWMTSQQREDLAQRGFPPDAGSGRRGITEREARVLLSLAQMVPVTLSQVRSASAIPDAAQRQELLLALKAQVQRCRPEFHARLRRGPEVLPPELRWARGPLQSCPDTILEEIDKALRLRQPLIAPASAPQLVIRDGKELRARFQHEPKRCRFCKALLPRGPLPHFILVVDDPRTGQLVQACPNCCAKRGLTYRGRFWVPQAYGGRRPDRQ